MKTDYKEMTVQSALTKLKRKIPYGWDLNIYRGCGHGCRYCYAIGSHQYLESDDFFGEIYAKINIAEALERELCSPSWKREIVNIGGVTDSYQPAEARYKLMPDILRLLIKYKTPAIISTKSKLILRDYDLINELSRLTYINIASTITAMDESVREKIEPGGSKTTERFEILREFRKTNASTGLHLMPIIPYVTDGEQNFDPMFKAACECRVHYVLAGTLCLRGAARETFFEFAMKEFPDEYEKLRLLYTKGGADRSYKTELYEKVNRLREKYGLSSSWSKPMKEKMTGIGTFAKAQQSFL
jgi:DNA repair photolyase